MCVVVNPNPGQWPNADAKCKGRMAARERNAELKNRSGWNQFEQCNAFSFQVSYDGQPEDKQQQQDKQMKHTHPLIL